MTRRSRTPELVFGAATAVVFAVAGAAGVAALSKPADFKARTAALEQDVDLTARLLRHRGQGPAVPRGSVCGADPQAAAMRLKAELLTLAALSHLDRPEVEVVAKPAAGGDLLSPLQVRFEASGPYEGALAAMDRISGLRPLVFVDTADLTSKTSFVTLAVTGRAYCASPRSS